MNQGVIKVWKNNRGFGFIKPNSGEDDVFLHVTGFQVRPKNIRVGDVVFFKEKTGKKGKPEAYDVYREGDKPKTNPLTIALAIGIPVIIIAAYFTFQSMN